MENCNCQMKTIEDRCPICHGYKSKSTTTFTVDLKFGLVVIRDVPADVCEQCGADWISDKDAEMLEDMVNDAKAKHAMIKVASFPDLLKDAS